jgi:hypothetical protein
MLNSTLSTYPAQQRRSQGAASARAHMPAGIWLSAPKTRTHKSGGPYPHILNYLYTRPCIYVCMYLVSAFALSRGRLQLASGSAAASCDNDRPTSIYVPRCILRGRSVSAEVSRRVVAPTRPLWPRLTKLRDGQRQAARPARMQQRRATQTPICAFRMLLACCGSYFERTQRLQATVRSAAACLGFCKVRDRATRHYMGRCFQARAIRRI